MSSLNKYTEFYGDNPFGSQAKILFHIDKLYNYIYNGDTFPLFMEISLTDICNLNCSWCITKNRKNFTIKTEPLLKFLKEFKDCGGKAVTFSGGGEPTLHKDFVKIVEYSKSIGLELGLMTNGVFDSSLCELIDNSFKWIRISLDTVNKTKYLQWKGKDRVDLILENLKRFKITKVGVNCNVSEDLDVSDVEALIKDTINFADYIQFRPVLPRFFKKEQINVNKEVWEYLEQYKDNDIINLSNDKIKELANSETFPFNTCEGHFFMPILNSDGDIKVCMYHPCNPNLSFGNIYDNSFTEIWKSEKRKEAIDYVRKMNYKTECQICCKLYEINKLINFIKFPKENIDKNFL